MDKSYVEHRDGGYYLLGTRISLDSIVRGFQRGDSPETLAQSFELLSLEEIYGAITYYLANQTEIDGISAAGNSNGKRGAARPRRCRSN